MLASGALLALRDPAPPAYRLLRGFGGAAGWAAVNEGDPNAKGGKEADYGEISSIIE